MSAQPCWLQQALGAELMKFLQLVLALCAMLASPRAAQDSPASLVPQSERIIAQRGFGYSDLATRKPGAG
jgi:hypothetical protein